MTTTPRKGSFSIHEDDAIFRKYGTMPTARLARSLQRTPDAVERRALRVFQGPPVIGRWDPKETATLVRLLGTATIPQLATILRRPANDVQDTLSRLRSRTKKSNLLDGAALMEFRAVYSSRTDEDLSTMFRIDQACIESIAKEQCLQKDKAFLRSTGAATTKMPRWTPDEVSRLTTLYPETSNHEIAQRLERSLKSVVSKAHGLGLKKDPERLRQMGRENVSKRYRD